MARRGKNFYRGIDFTPPTAAATAARRALDRRQLANRQGLSPATIDRMISYFARHQVDKQGSSWGSYGKGRQAWDGWGGDPGAAWARSVAKRMDAAERRAAK